MKIRTLLFGVVISIAVISIGINTIILTSLTGKDFNAYVQSNYEDHVEQINSYAKQLLLANEISLIQVKMELETHLNDPITGIEILRTDGSSLIDVTTDENTSSKGNYKVKSRMMGEMMRDMLDDQEITDAYHISDGSKIIGYVYIRRQSSTENSYLSLAFKANLFRNSILSVLIVISLTLLIALFLSKSMSRSLKETSAFAKTLLLDEPHRPKASMIQEITVLQDRLFELRDRLKLRQRSRKTNMDTLVHQARTPLTVLKTHIEAIGDGIIEPTQEEIILCLSQVDTITATLESMGNILDVEDRSIELHKERMDAAVLTDQIVTGLKLQFEKKGISLDYADKESLEMNSDRSVLSQVLYNILTNAYKYTPENGKVTVRTYRKEGMSVIEVQDTGIGIDPSEQKKIFEAYYRSADASNIQGEGLGLYLAGESMKALGGTIEIESNIGKGSRFKLCLPETLKVKRLEE